MIGVSRHLTPDLNMEAVDHVIRSSTFQGVHSNGLDVFAKVIGWGYFLAWSLSFYPQVHYLLAPPLSLPTPLAILANHPRPFLQIWLNFRRKNVSGLSLDFVTLNITGFFAYTVFNVVLKYDNFVKDLYIQKYGGEVPVEINDIVFAVHAFILTLVTAAQVLYYPRAHDQKVSNISIGINAVLWFAMALFTWLAVGGKFSWLSDVYIFSYVKLIITLVKYIPQAWSNFMRKSTEGWSIGQNLLDLAGGLLSFGQQFIQAINVGDWAIIYGNPVKLGLALISIAFDLIFMSQHYICYNSKPSEDEESSLDTVPINRNGTPTGSGASYGSYESLPSSNGNGALSD